MKVQKPERLVGYILLIIGLVIVLIPAVIAILILVGSMQMPQYVEKPNVTGTGAGADLARVLADSFPLLNIIPTFLLFVVLVYAGGVLMGKGIGMIKEIQWKIVKAGKEETKETETEPEKAPEPSAKPAKKTKTEEQAETE